MPALRCDKRCRPFCFNSDCCLNTLSGGTTGCCALFFAASEAFLAVLLASAAACAKYVLGAPRFIIRGVVPPSEWLLGELLGEERCLEFKLALWLLSKLALWLLCSAYFLEASFAYVSASSFFLILSIVSLIDTIDAAFCGNIIKINWDFGFQRICLYFSGGIYLEILNECDEMWMNAMYGK